MQKKTKEINTVKLKKNWLDEMKTCYGLFENKQRKKIVSHLQYYGAHVMRPKGKNQYELFIFCILISCMMTFFDYNCPFLH